MQCRRQAERERESNEQGKLRLQEYVFGETPLRGALIKRLSEQTVE